ncbi:hypothetical protein LINGRAHAP2_LOCUS14286, partial [Linum grandiflorum]
QLFFHILHHNIYINPFADNKLLYQFTCQSISALGFFYLRIFCFAFLFVRLPLPTMISLQFDPTDIPPGSIFLFFFTFITLSYNYMVCILLTLSFLLYVPIICRGTAG